MRPVENRPVLVAVALDHESHDVLRSAAEVARRIGAPLHAVHVLRKKSLAKPHTERVGEAREQLDAHLAAVAEEGLTILEPTVLTGRASDQIVELAQRHHAQMIVTGGGGPATVRRWVLGSTAEAIVRASIVPVYVVRGVLPIGRPIVCPVDLTPSSRVGLTVALRMARLFETPLFVLHVLPESGDRIIDAEELTRRVGDDVAADEAKLNEFVAAHDTSGVELHLKVMIGPPAERIVEAAEDAALLVLGSRRFELLRPGGVGGVVERAVRFSRSSVLTMRDPNPEHEGHAEQLERVAKLKTGAEEHMRDGNHAAALPLLELATSLAPVNAAIQDRFAEALDGVGRADEATHRRELAKFIRDRFS